MNEDNISPERGDEQLSNNDNPSKRPQSSSSSTLTGRSRPSESSNESTPLLARERGQQQDDASSSSVANRAAAALLSLQGRFQTSRGKSRRWPTIIALCILCALVVVIMVVGFFTPRAMQEYAETAMIFEPTNLSIDSFTSSGVRARIQGDFVLDASRVHKKAIRDLGRAGTWIARKAESGPTVVEVYFPKYGDLALGKATVPRIVFNLRNGRTTHIDFLTDIEPGESEILSRVAKDWLDDRLSQLEVKGKADVKLKSGIFKLGTQQISTTLTFQDDDVPEIPNVHVDHLEIREISTPKSSKGMSANVSLKISNNYPVKFTVPPLGFNILVPNCVPSEPYIMVAHATTESIMIEPRQPVHVNASGVVRELPDTLTSTCPSSHSSPLDLLLTGYLKGQKTTLYVRGSETGLDTTPPWIAELISSVTVPIPFPEHSFKDLIKNFSLENVHINLPDPFAEPDTPEARPKLSAVVKAVVTVPDVVNFPLNVSSVRAGAEIFYHGKELGILDLHKWQEANSSSVIDERNNTNLQIESIVNDAPLEITNEDTFAELMQKLIFQKQEAILTVAADVDVKVDTVLGQLTMKRIPAKGSIPIKPIAGKGLESFAPKVGSLKILETTESSLSLQASVNFTNPTNYSAAIPFVDFEFLSNGTMLGHATAKNILIVPGSNENVVVEALWAPATSGGPEGEKVGKELLSQYISGYNTTVTLRAHEGSIPAQPTLGKALSSLEIDIQSPRLRAPKTPDDGDDDGEDDQGPKFIKDATMHLLTSTATFVLLSPLPHTTLYITHIDATAFYNHTEPVGRIVYNYPIAIPPGISQTPRLPVTWNLNSVGYDAVRRTLGGSLKLDAKAVLGVRIGEWGTTVWFQGGGIGAKIRL
ncbi:hypothetical protein L228DRAFT_280953 [Xylona heveae TC161]|uniref:Pre-rRNA processing protein n=1 Tax=Xylona heveae (strain CBS 132557 / TC161) TaxID=1328760 RepID=A0A165J4T7_XYLHT|nr:hypothetical protein L228DRAFT_280953 [Xylona heveae TC161]KZF25733.1 hypothetical protein L228DRAFT_280953 [Xylona heveae TC161]